ncbi:MAG TPA: RNA polymerase sigma factor [Phaeodactylibacter sp.]|nr:RNA polymerase sigma factor [Phaeodactylibacter sp.]
MLNNHAIQKYIAGCRENNFSSQMALYRHFYSFGMGIAARYARSKESAEEILNDAFMKVFLKIDQYDSAMPFKPWLRRIIVNTSIDYFRKYEDKRVELYALDSAKEESTNYNLALDNLEFNDLLLIMRKLPPAYQAVFNLYVVEGMSHADIAEKLGISIGTSKSNLSKARIKIKELLKEVLNIHIKTKTRG